MARLIVGRPVAQASAVLLVENALAVGRHRFRLVVIDKSGNESAPAEIVVAVRPPPRPAAVPSPPERDRR